ncbi:unnamed protein product [Sphagnum jensenii]|uniref:J domain-containing protein n=1 Tax=Sphagnum jensenii TaxID=128206 RepID=A0ABP1A7I4_9BRYO
MPGMLGCKQASIVTMLTVCIAGKKYHHHPTSGGGSHYDSSRCLCTCRSLKLQAAGAAAEESLRCWFTLENTKLKEEGWSKSWKRLHNVSRRRPAGAAKFLFIAATAVSDPPTFYDVLGLANNDVALPDIKTAYRQMARRYHPDVCPPEELEENTKRFLEVQEAYETLSDSRRRAMYDAHLLNFGPRKRWDLNAVGEGVHWKRQWEGQLSGLQYRNTTKDVNSNSWGARMRRKKEQEQQEQSS